MNAQLEFIRSISSSVSIRSAYALSLLAEPSQDNLHKLQQIIEIFSRRPVDNFEVHPAVFMDNEISKAHSLYHPFRKSRRDDPVFLQKVEELISASGNTELFFGDHVRGDVDAALYGHLEIEQDAFLPVQIFKEYRKSHLALFDNAGHMTPCGVSL